MSLRTEIFWESLNRYEEELCGDKVEIVQYPKETIVVMADGLGSGVKANILATLTTKIAATMLKKGATIEETVETIVSTLPICKVRKIAYSTFTIIRVDSQGKCYVAEYGNPPIFFLKNNEIINVKGRKRIIAGKEVKESHFRVTEGDMLIIVSDGIVHAGVGGLLNLGWQWDNIARYINKVSKVESNTINLVKLLISVTSNFYMEKPGDDATVVALKIITPRQVVLFTGPPQDKSKDKIVVDALMASEGKKIVCGGTAAQIVSRELEKEINTSIDFIDPRIPPTAQIDGLDLVTEGVLTLARTREILGEYILEEDNYSRLNKLNKEDGATKLAKILLEATDIKFLLGKAINPAHQNPDFPKELSIKLNIVREIIDILNKMGKRIKIKYYD